MRSRAALSAIALVCCAVSSAGAAGREDLATSNATLAWIARVPGLSRSVTRLERTADGFRVIATAPDPRRWIPAGEGNVDVLLPLDARAPLRVSMRGNPAFWLEVASLDDVRSVAGVAIDGAVIMNDVAPSLDVVHVAERNGVEELRVLRTAAAASVARYALRVGPAVASLVMNGDRVELRDAQGYVRIASAPMFAVDAKGRRRDVRATLAGSTLTTTLDPVGLAYPIVVDPVWAAAGNMEGPRMSHTATILADGRVLVAGGQIAGNQPITTAEIYDPKTNAWSAAAPLSGKRTKHAAVLLPNGKVLVAGGLSSTSTFDSLATTALYDPATDSWSVGPRTSVARETPVMARLPSGKVLIAGGGPTAEMYDATANAWSSAGSLPNSMHGGGTAGALFVFENGKAGFFEYNRVHIYDPATNQWTDGPDHPMARGNCIVAQLPDSKALTIGGYGALATGGFGPLTSGDIYSAASNTWVGKTTMTKARIYGSAALRTPNELLLIGGLPDTGQPANAAAESLDIGANTWSPAGSLARPRIFHATSVFANGQVLITGGAGDSTAGAISLAELFVPSTSDAAACKDDVTSVGKDGVPHACLPFRCGASGSCNKECTSSTECAPGNNCDPATKTCRVDAPAAAAEEASGCAASRSRGGSGSEILLALAAIALARASRLRGES